VVVAFDAEEIVGLSDRVLVMHHGRIVANLSGDAMTGHTIIAASFGKPIEVSKERAR
jgi:ABC-type sugar transport system ATPase subunit